MCIQSSLQFVCIVYVCVRVCIYVGVYVHVCVCAYNIHRLLVSALNSKIHNVISGAASPPAKGMAERKKAGSQAFFSAQAKRVPEPMVGHVLYAGLVLYG